MGSNKRVNWGLEVLRVLGVIGKVLFRIFSYFMNILLTVLLIGLITGIIVCTTFAIYINTYLDLTVDPDQYVTVNQDTTTRLYYMDYETQEDRLNRNGTPVEIEDQRLSGAGGGSIAVPYSQIPKNLVYAFIAIEDQQFESHNGVNWWKTAQSVFKFVFGGSGGGSTITQQLIKNVTGEDDVTIQRKVQEIFRAMNLEKLRSKDEIMEMYLNIIYFGNGCEGVQAASNYYFDKDVSELSLAECASLAAIVKNPSQYNPKSHDEDFYTTVNGEQILKRGNKFRRKTVLDCMLEEGYINETEWYEARYTELTLATHEDEEEEVDAGMTIYNWYTEAAINQLKEDLMEKYGITPKAACNLIYYSGYKIYLPMDPFVQDTLEEVYENDTEYFPMTWSGGLQPQSAMVVCDPYTCDVLGVVGGRGMKTLNLGTERATQSTRPPGSSIKPLSVYAPALDAGLITYGSVVDDTPVMFNAYTAVAATEYSDAIIGYTPYPQNYPVVYRGLTTINSAITRSVNTIAMKVLQMLTIDVSFDFMKNELKFDSLIDSYTKSNGEVLTDRGLAALSLGQPNYGVTLLEMTAAYTIFQNNGVFNEPNLYLYVEDASGKIVLENVEENNIVIQDTTASIMTIMMEKVMNEGTGTGCTLRNTVDVAGKTGTTSADFDRYFVGYTPYYVGGVWTGYDMPQSLSSFAENPSLVVWDKVMTMLHQPHIEEAANGGEQLKTFETAPGVIQATYCKDSGKLCTDACSLDPRGWRSETGYFTRQTVPTEYCDTHVTVKRDSTTNLIASPECNPENCYDVALIRVENRSFPIEIYVEDAQYVYREMPSHVKPSGWWGVPFFVNMLGEYEYCGSSYPSSGTPYNAYCYFHCDYRPWGGNPPAQDSGFSPDVEEPPNDETENEPGDTGQDTGQEETSETDIPPDADIDLDGEENEDDIYNDDFFWNDWFE